jgi:hypothetical protein
MQKLYAIPNPDAQVAKWVLSPGVRPLALYHIINATTMAADLTNGQTLPIALPGAGNLTVLRNPANPFGNITFVGAADKTDPAANNTNAANDTNAANNTNAASILVEDIAVIGRPDILMHVVDSVLMPPEAVFNQGAKDLAVEELEKAVEQAPSAAAATPAGGAAAKGDTSPKTDNSTAAPTNTTTEPAKAHACCAGASILPVLVWVAMALLFAC